MNPSDELIAFLADLARKTMALDIVWTKSSAAAYTWRRSSTADRPTTVTTIQAAKGTRYMDYAFSVATIEKGSVISQINLTTNEKPELRDILSELFEAAKSSADSQTVKALKDLLG